ncbi:MAG: hypothetical protein UX87_C0011G0022 [Candidatus Amesbacteria bacterium GW2011_GWA1_47_16]|uniref:Uncharacterized protein n=1 Tax=Candidatus Amesbacteria bacterium GW2011_GWA1_47_16 TaxID=1618353 RepID=A0A0G1V2K8_9BACT|nr:MAG: hypothetical protein UX87_C0011G0022 [Candidatus Amesbacteria bacterium GW2011_GWA1_47_16]
MPRVWDYDPEELSKTEFGRLKLLERMVNYGPAEGELIDLAQVKANWDKLNLFTGPKRLMELLIWGKPRSLHRTKNSFWMK